MEEETRCLAEAGDSVSFSDLETAEQEIFLEVGDNQGCGGGQGRGG